MSEKNPCGSCDDRHAAAETLAGYTELSGKHQLLYRKAAIAQAEAASLSGLDPMDSRRVAAVSYARLVQNIADKAALDARQTAELLQTAAQALTEAEFVCLDTHLPDFEDQPPAGGLPPQLLK
jgi:hypothetical protein